MKERIIGFFYPIFCQITIPILIAIDFWQIHRHPYNMASNILHLSIDRFGRIVLPKEIRDRFGVKPGTEFEVEEKGDLNLLKPVVKEAQIINKNGWLVVKGSGKPMTVEEADQLIDKVREERNRQIVGDLKGYQCPGC